jgi:hypothetical protein
VQASSRKSPCPFCGRTKDADCRWKADVILCHQGTSHKPPSDLRRGDVINIAGKSWALIRRDGGFDGAAAVFKPHNPRRKVPNRDHQHRFDTLTVDPKDVVLHAAHAVMAGLVQDIDRALSVPDFQFSLPHELQADFQLVEETSNAVAAFKQTLLKLQRSTGGLERHLAQLTQALEDLGHVCRDVKRFKRCALGEPTDKKITSLNRG